MTTPEDPMDDMLGTDDPGADPAPPPPPEPDVVLEARELLAAAVADVEASQERMDAADDDLADARGALAVAEARAEDFRANEEKQHWQQVEAAEATARAERTVQRARSRVEKARIAHAAAQQRVAAASQALQAAQQAPPEPETGPKNLYPNVYAFVSEWLTPVYARDIRAQNADRRWCPRWWDHAEAVARLEALWKAFEALRLDPGTGASVWWRDHCDPCMRALMAPDGPFQRCSTESHDLLHALDMEEPPAALMRLDGS